jgi:hypothetical protein
MVEIGLEELRELYVDRGFTYHQLTEHFGVSLRTISRRMNRCGIPPRRVGRPCNRKVGQEHKRSDGRVMVYMPKHPRAHNGNVYRALLVWEEFHGHPLPKGVDIHHVNGIPDDDRPENLMAMTHGEHTRLHDLERHRNTNKRAKLKA